MSNNKKIYKKSEIKFNKKLVTKNYLKNFNHLSKFIDEDSKLGKSKFNVSDSTAITPFLSRLNKYVQDNELNENENRNINFAVDGLSDPYSHLMYERELTNPNTGVKYKRKTPFVTRSITDATINNETFKEIQNKASNLSDKDLKKLLDVDYANILGEVGDLSRIKQAKKAMSLIPENISTMEAIKYGFHAAESPLEGMLRRPSRGMRNDFRERSTEKTKGAILKLNDQYEDFAMPSQKSIENLSKFIQSKANGGYLNDNNKTTMNTGYGQNTKSMNQGGMIPSYAYGGGMGMPQYGMGSWIKNKGRKLGQWSKDNAQGIAGGAMIAGGALVTAGTFGLGAGIGVGMMASGAGMMADNVGTNNARKDADAQNLVQQKQLTEAELAANESASLANRNNIMQSRMSEYGSQQGQQGQYGATFAKNGGFISSLKGNGAMTSGNIRSSNDTKTKAYGGKIDTSMNPNVSTIDNGGTHEESSLNGVPIGNRGLLEEGEVKVKIGGNDYVFSNRF